MSEGTSIAVILGTNMWTWVGRRVLSLWIGIGMTNEKWQMRFELEFIDGLVIRTYKGFALYLILRFIYLRCVKGKSDEVYRGFGHVTRVDLGIGLICPRLIIAN